MATKKTPLDKLDSAISGILQDYADGVIDNVTELTQKFARKGAQAVKGAASSNGWGNYAQGWTSQMDTGRLSAQGTIYNQKTPGLPHLLENGHALRNGGRSRAFPHISPVEEKISEEFLKAVKKEI